MNKNLKKAGTSLLLSALVVGGAFAWLSTTKTATSENMIKPGTFSVKFANQKDTITLQDSFPMTPKYAMEHLTPYTYTVRNTGDIAMDYVVTAIDKTGNLVDNVKLLNSSSEGKYWKQLNQTPDYNGEYGGFNSGEEASVPSSYIEAGHLEPGEEKVHTLYAYIDSNYTNKYNGPIDGKTASFKLSVKAVQDTDGKAPYLVTYIPGLNMDGTEPEIVKTIGNLINSNQYQYQDYDKGTMYEFNGLKRDDGKWYLGGEEVNDTTIPTFIQKFKDAGFSTVEYETPEIASGGLFKATNAEGHSLEFRFDGPPGDWRILRVSITINR